jgi:hypothetical protein
MTGHGFRAAAGAALNEKGFNPDAIERQLAQGENNEVRETYNRAKILSKRISGNATSLFDPVACNLYCDHDRDFA